MKYPPLPNWVGGRAAEFRGESAEVVSPLDGSYLSRVPLSGPGEVDAAVRAAAAAFPAWSAETLRQRSQVAYAYRELLRRHTDELAGLIHEENGKTVDEARAEIVRAWGVTPDLVTVAKGIGNGAPLGACVTRPEVAAVMARRVHFNTFGGNPVSVTQGLATLDVIDRDGIQENARVVGGHLKERLAELAERQPLIGEVRGMGLMLGVELVRDRATKEPATAEAADVLELAKDRGLLIGKGGLFGNTLRIKPPMCLTKDDADFLVDCLDEVLGKVGDSLRESRHSRSE